MAFAKSYYGIKLSDNIAESEPEKYLIFRNAVIARTGSQTYKGSELPQRDADTPETDVTAQDLGVGANDNIELYRPIDEVFSPRFIASLQGKPITDEHPNDLLDLDTVANHIRGHLIDVRPGTEPLPDGNMPLLADGMITDKNLKMKILSGLRDLSLGYNYSIARDGNRTLQVDLIGNHCAVVPNGRAGSASIRDSAEKVLDVIKEKIAIPIHRGKIDMSKFAKLINGLGLQAFAKDAKPEDLGDFLDELQKSKTVAKDAESVEETIPEQKKEMPKESTTAEDAAKVAKDAKAKDRQKFHDALERHLDAKDAESNAAKDADESAMDDLKSLFAKDSEVSAEEKEDIEESIKAEKTPGSNNEEEESIMDEDLDQASPIIEPINREMPIVNRAVDAAAMDAALVKARQEGAVIALNELKPVIAASRNQKTINAFDSICKEINKSGVVKKSGKGGYAAAATSAIARDAAVANDTKNSPDEIARLANEAYKAASIKMSNAGFNNSAK